MTTYNAELNQYVVVDMGDAPPHVVNAPPQTGTTPKAGHWFGMKIVSESEIGASCTVDPNGATMEDIDGDGFTSSPVEVALSFEYYRWHWLRTDNSGSNFAWVNTGESRPFPFPQQFFLAVDEPISSGAGTYPLPLTFDTTFRPDPVHWVVDADTFTLNCVRPFAGYAEISAFYELNSNTANNVTGDLQIQLDEFGGTSPIIQDVYGIVDSAFARGDSIPRSGYLRFLCVASAAAGDRVRLNAKTTLANSYESIVAAGTNVRFTTI